jgi:hypothetical protein
MSAAGSDHNRVLTLAAREGLRPLGLTQKGRSRLWFDDHGWWLILVEFQPSAWSKGSYLNVGFQHLWRVTEHFSFGGHERLLVDGEQFLSLDETHPESFQAGATRLVDEAQKAVEQRRQDHRDGTEAVERIAEGETVSIFESFDAGISLGLLGDAQGADRRFGQVLEGEPTFAWLAALQEQARAIASLLGDRDKFGAEVNRLVELTRATLRLAPWEGQILK